uniref:phosphoserine transaminase n=1 Tax=Bartheletia paradoxa TaxID=669517 RepID=A0A2D0XKH0_9BASI|nr:hypothetical protein SPAR04568 [Bartheletia paradoxa]
MAPRAETYNFGAGPSCLPEDVLREAARGIIDYESTGIGLTEISHRSKEFSALVQDAKKNLKEALQLPDDYTVLFTQGGGSLQFSSVALNLLSRYAALHPTAPSPSLDYLVTGSWSSKAAAEARRLGGNVNVVLDTRKSSKNKKFDNLPSNVEAKGWNWTRGENKPAYVYYCDNETVDGIEFGVEGFPVEEVDEDVPLIADMSSNILSRPIPNLHRHALIYAGAQKNIGPAGLTIIIVRSSLLVDVDAPFLPTAAHPAPAWAPRVPQMLSYKLLADNDSLYNTPPMFAIYLSNLVVRRLLSHGGVPAIQVTNERKAEKLYEAIEKLQSFEGKVESGRSRMNVVFEVKGEGREKTFLEGAEERGLRQLKGHRSVGGIRASLYNAVSEEAVDVLIQWMEEFDKSA